MKKFFALFLLMCMLLSTVGAVAESIYPLKPEEGFQLKMWIEFNAGTSQVYTDLDDSPMYQDYQKVTGIDIDFYHPTYGATAESFAKVLSGGLEDMPHVMVDFQKNYKGGLVAAYDDGMIYDLTPYLEEYAPNYYKLINSSEEAKRQFYNEDGQVLAFSVFNTDISTVADCFIYQKNLLDEFGMDPTTWKTFDDMEVFLDAVVAKYPDMIPFACSLDRVRDFIGMGYNIADDFYVVDGAVRYYANDDNYKAMLTMLNEWYSKGYLSVDFATLKNANVRKQFSAEKVASFIAPIGNAYSDAQAANNEIVKGPYLAMSEDFVGHLMNAMDVNINQGYDTVITTALPEKYVPLVCQFLDFCYSEEGQIYSNWGPEGLSWNWVDGERKHTDWVMNNEKFETSIMHNVCRLSYYPRWDFYSDLYCANIVRDEVVANLRKMYNPMPGWDSTYYIPNGVQLSLDESTRRAKLMTDVDTYTKECLIKFVKGEMSIENDWDAYLKQLEKFGLSEAVQLTQDAYDRYMSR